MDGWGFWEWLCYILIGVQAIVSTISAALAADKNVANRTARLTSSPFWRVAPGVALVLSALIIIANQLGWTHPTQINKSTHPVTIIRTVKVPTTDPAQSARIADLERQLKLALARPSMLISHRSVPVAIPSATPITQVPSIAQPTQQSSQIPSIDAALVEEVGCQKDQQEKLDELARFIRMADRNVSVLEEGSITSDQESSDYSDWLAEVKKYLKSKKWPSDTVLSMFDNAYDNETEGTEFWFMSDTSEKLWRNYNGKIGQLGYMQSMVKSVPCSQKSKDEQTGK